MQALDRRVKLLEQRQPLKLRPITVLICAMQRADLPSRPSHAVCNGQTINCREDQTREDFHSRAIAEIKQAQPGLPTYFVFVLEKEAPQRH